MKILLNGRDGWRVVESVRYEDEDALQSLLKASPEIIPSDPQGGAAATAWCREFPTAAGPIDLLGLGSDGSVTIMECKLARNQQIRREVVGQVLDYASALWGVALDSIESSFARLEGATAIDQLAERLGTQEPDWEPGLVRAALEKTLADGSFRLLVAVDEMDQGLKRIITYVNTRGGSGQRLKLVALTFPRYERDGIEILVPESFGDEAPTAASASPKRVGREWTEEEFLEVITDREHPTAGELARELIAWMRTVGTEPTFGHGATGPLYVHMPVLDGMTISAFDLSAADHGRFEILFTELAKARPFDEPGPRRALRDRFNEIPNVNIAERTADEANWTGFAVSRVADADARRTLFEILDWAAAQVAPG